MKTHLLKCMPHVPLQKLKFEGQEQNTQHSDGIIEDLNAVGGQDINEAPVDVVENIETAEDATATFQCRQYDVRNKDEGLGAIRRTTQFFGKAFRRVKGDRHRNKCGSENVVQLTSYGNNESSENDSDENFQDDITLVHRTQRF